jgi:hypothetical protein
MRARSMALYSPEHEKFMREEFYGHRFNDHSSPLRDAFYIGLILMNIAAPIAILVKLIGG